MEPNHQKFHLNGVQHISAVEAFNMLKEVQGAAYRCP